MTDRKKLGVRVDADVWARFREDVRERKGQTRGVLGDEVETALRQYLGESDDPDLDRLDTRLQRIEAAVGTATTDGGADTFDGDAHTHAPPSRLDAASEDKPAPNAATEKKVRWLAARVCTQEGKDADEIKQLPERHLREVVKAEYGFRRDTAARYVEELIDHFGLVSHPTTDEILCTPAERERIVRERTDVDNSANL